MARYACVVLGGLSGRPWRRVACCVVRSILPCLVYCDEQEWLLVGTNMGEGLGAVHVICTGWLLAARLWF
jgi:hypothetical protein